MRLQFEESLGGGWVAPLSFLSHCSPCRSCHASRNKSCQFEPLGYGYSRSVSVSLASCQICGLFCSQRHIVGSQSSPGNHPLNRGVAPLYRLYMKYSLALKRTCVCRTSREQHFVNTQLPDVFWSSIIELIVSMSIAMLSRKPTSRGARALKSWLTILPMNTPRAAVEMSPCSHACLSWGGNWVITGDSSKKVGSGVHLELTRRKKCALLPVSMRNRTQWASTPTCRGHESPLYIISWQPPVECP